MASFYAITARCKWLRFSCSADRHSSMPSSNLASFYEIAARCRRLRSFERRIDRTRHNSAPPQNLGRVEEGRGPGTYWQPCVSLPRSANRTCRFPASGFPTVFTIQTHAVAPAPTFLKRNTSNFSAIPLINYANIISYLEHRITNAASESLNAKIQWVKYTARGFRNKQNFIHAIYFDCGGLDLAPSSTK